MPSGPRAAGSGVARGVAIGVVSLVFALPVLFLIAGSLRLPGLPPPEGVEWIPSPLTTETYRFVFDIVPLHRHLLNSMVVVGIAVPLTVVIASWAGFAIVMARPEVGRRLVLVSLLALMIPPVALWAPRFVMFKQLNLTGTLWPLIAPALMATSPFFVLLFAAWYARLPRTLFDAARLESASSLDAWRRVALPLSMPAIAAVGLLAFVFHWSNFADALFYLNRAEVYTLPVGLRALQTLEPANFSILLAGAVVATAPAIVVFLVAQRSLFKEVLP